MLGPTLDQSTTTNDSASPRTVCLDLATENFNLWDSPSEIASPSPPRTVGQNSCPLATSFNQDQRIAAASSSFSSHGADISRLTFRSHHKETRRTSGSRAVALAAPLWPVHPVHFSNPDVALWSRTLLFAFQKPAVRLVTRTSHAARYQAHVEYQPVVQQSPRAVV